MELKYEKAMKDNNLKVDDLPKDAQIGISNINDVLKGVRMLEKKGKTVSGKTLEKIAAMDKWVYYEILDHLAGTDENEEVMPDKKGALEQIKKDEKGDNKGAPPATVVVAKVIEEEGKNQVNTNVVDEKGVKIDADLKTAFDGGKTKMTLQELKDISKTAYDVIFDAYDDSGDNGIETSLFSLLETSDNEFTLTKK